MRKNRANIETKKKALKQCIYIHTDGPTDKVICRGRAKKTVLKFFFCKINKDILIMFSTNVSKVIPLFVSTCEIVRVCELKCV